MALGYNIFYSNPLIKNQQQTLEVTRTKTLICIDIFYDDGYFIMVNPVSDRIDKKQTWAV